MNPPASVACNSKMTPTLGLDASRCLEAPTSTFFGIEGEEVGVVLLHERWAPSGSAARRTPRSTCCSVALSLGEPLLELVESPDGVGRDEQDEREEVGITQLRRVVGGESVVGRPGAPSGRRAFVEVLLEQRRCRRP